MFAASHYSNMGNYKSFGDSKFIPNVSQVSIIPVKARPVTVSKLKRQRFFNHSRSLFLSCLWFCVFITILLSGSNLYMYTCDNRFMGDD